jgi:predicted nucleic acid-binding Zn ribbon protein
MRILIDEQLNGANSYNELLVMNTMSHLEETVLRTESGICLQQKGDKKYRFNPPAGTLILTDQRVIFAQSGGEFAKRIVVGGLLGGIVGSEAMRMTTKVKKEHLDEALQRQDSFEIHMGDLINLSQKSEFGAHLLLIESRAPGVERVNVYRQGGLSGLKRFDEWITDINAAKQRVPTGYQQPPMMPQPIPSQPAPQYVMPAPIPQAAPGGRFCPNCGQPVGVQDKFCLNCGVSLQQAPQQTKCPKCGNALNPNQRFCNLCGTQVR